MRDFHSSRSKAIDLPGCSSEKGNPFLCLMIHLLAESAAISVSLSILRRALFESLLRSSGMPLGWRELLRGLGGHETPGIGISRALEKVAQFGAKWAESAFMVSYSNNSASRKTSRPLKRSQGGKQRKQGQHQNSTSKNPNTQAALFSYSDPGCSVRPLLSPGAVPRPLLSSPFRPLWPSPYWPLWPSSACPSVPYANLVE